MPIQLESLAADCWQPEPEFRPTFTEIIARLERCKNITLPQPSRNHLSIPCINEPASCAASASLITFNISDHEEDDFIIIDNPDSE